MPIFPAHFYGLYQGLLHGLLPARPIEYAYLPPQPNQGSKEQYQVPDGGANFAVSGEPAATHGRRSVSRRDPD